MSPPVPSLRKSEEGWRSWNGIQQLMNETIFKVNDKNDFPILIVSKRLSTLKLCTGRYLEKRQNKSLANGNDERKIFRSYSDVGEEKGQLEVVMEKDG